jgi:hypothetical protein
MPLPGSRVIHPRWSEHHLPTATAAFTGRCVITRASGTGSTGEDGTWTPSPDSDPPVYSGRCRAVGLGTDQGRFRVSGDAQETPRRYAVSIEYNTARILIGDTITFTEAQDDEEDAGLVGLQFRVVDVAYGTEQWQRDLLAEEIQP